jgi:hypothetical protein
MNICTMIMDALVQAITDACQTPYAADDPYRINLVKRGMFQDDPQERGPIVTVERNYRDKSDNVGSNLSWLDERARVEMGMAIGSLMEHWVRRFTCIIQVWPEGLTQDEAEELNSTIVANVRRAVTKKDLTGIQDAEGERISIGVNPVSKMKVREGGGPDTEYHWVTYLFLEYKTEYQPR